MKRRILFMGNGSFRNGGCEAITKGTMEILKNSFGDFEVIDAYFPEKTGSWDEAIPNRLSIPITYPRRWSPRWILLQIALRTSNTLVTHILFKKYKNYIKNTDIVLSLGGDTYSLDYGKPERLIAMGKYVKSFHKPFVIWGASVGPFCENPKFENKILNHIRNDVSLVILREENSMLYLKKHNAEKHSYVLADPAFMMLSQYCQDKLPSDFPEKYVCINFSDLMAKYVTDGNMEEWINICVTTINLFHEHCSFPLVFVPHVKSDADLLSQILKKMSNKSTIIALPSSLNAAEMKWVISRSVCNIACRTHSTIASFSTAIPTISLGYSIKSKGLNMQMYEHENFLLYKKEITAKNIWSTFVKIQENIEFIKFTLEEKCKYIKNLSIESGELLKNLPNAEY